MKILKEIFAVGVNLVKWVVLLMLLLVGLCCCRSQQRVVTVESKTEVAVHDTVERIREVYVRDSLESHTQRNEVVRDSMAPVLDSLNRVIGWERWHYREVYKESDTKQKALQAELDKLKQKRDSVVYREKPVPYAVTEYVNELKWWQEVLMWIGGLGVVGILITVIGVWKQYR